MRWPRAASGISAADALGDLGEEPFERADRLSARLVREDMVHPADQRREQDERHPQAQRRIELAVAPPAASAYWLTL